MSTLTAPSPLEIAIRYIEGGINVTPVRSPKAGVKDAGKQPYLMGWQNLRLSVVDFTEAYRQGSNIGIITGRTSGLICVDLDGKDGLAWYENNRDRMGHHIVERRGKGGIHLYFKYPENPNGGSVPSQLRLYPGVDILADGGKQVVTWPSVHRGGDTYTIDNGMTLLDVEHEADEPPAWLLEELYAHHAAKAPALLVADTATLSEQDAPHEIERCKAHLKNFPPAIQNQGGDATTFSAGCLCRDYNLSPLKAYEVMKEVYNPRCIPPWSDHDLAVKVKNAYQFAQSPAGTRTTGAIFTPIADEPQTTPESTLTYKPKFPVYCAGVYLHRVPEQTLCARDQLYAYSTGDHCWSMLEDSSMQSLVLADIGDSNPELRAVVQMQQLASTVKAIKRSLEGKNPHRELTADTWLDGTRGEFIAVQNGILDIATGDLRSHTPKWFSYTTLPFAFDPAAQCPQFMAFLNDIWDGDQELIHSLQQWFGYMLIKPMKEQKFAVFKGKSRGGKGTLLNLATLLVGERNTAATSLSSMAGDFGLEPLLGKRLAVIPEADKAPADVVVLASEKIKMITGNDRVVVNRKNISQVQIQLPIKFILACNSIPAFANDESAMTNRMVVFPFVKSFMGKEDLSLGDKLKEELPGILNWSLVGARELLAGERFVQSQAGLDAIEEISISLDTVKGFVKETIRFTGESHNRATNKQLWDAYRTWCHESGRHHKSRQRFLIELADALKGRATRFRSDDRGYAGLVIEHDSLEFFSDIETDEADDLPF